MKWCRNNNDVVFISCALVVTRFMILVFKTDLGAVAKDAKAIELKFWTKSEGQVKLYMCFQRRPHLM